MKISSFFLSAASADLFMPGSGTSPRVATFGAAVEICKNEFSASLANPHDHTQQQLLDATHGIYAWVGLYRASAQSKFFSIDRITSLFELVDVEPTRYNWESNQPSFSDGKEYCAAVGVDGKFNDDDCFQLFPFLCEGQYSEATRSGDSLSIIDAESAAIIREQQEFQNQEIQFNDFLDAAIQRTHEISKSHAHYLRNIKRVTMYKIQFSDRELCSESLYAEDRFQNVFFYWNLSRTLITVHENVCDIYRDYHDGIIHYIHEFGCTSNYQGDMRDIHRKFTRLLPIFCPDLTVVQKQFGIDF